MLFLFLATAEGYKPYYNTVPKPEGLRMRERVCIKLCGHIMYTPVFLSLRVRLYGVFPYITLLYKQPPLF